MPTDITINAVDYSDEMVDLIIWDSTSFLAAVCEVEVMDVDNSIRDAIERFQEIQLFNNSAHVWTGVVVDISDGEEEDGLITIFGANKWWYFLRTPVFRTFSSSPASTILKSIIDTELSFLGLTYTGIVTTTANHTIIARGQSVSSIFLELGDKETFLSFVDKDDDVVFKSNTATDTGITILEDDIWLDSFTRSGGEIVNKVIVRGAAGRPPNTKAVGAIHEDEALITKYGVLPTLEVNAPELTTPQLCKERAVYEVKRRLEDPQQGHFTTDLNFNLVRGALVKVNLPDRNFDFQNFLIQQARHDIVEDETMLKLVYYTRTNADMVQIIIENAKKAEHYLSDDSVILDLFKTIEVQMTHQVFFTVERQTVTGAAYGEFGYGGVKAYGAGSGSYITETSDEQGDVMNYGLEAMWAIASQLTISTPPFPLNQTNAYIAISSQSTTITFDNPSLDFESDREQCNAGYPQQPSEGATEWQIVVSDGDLSQGIIASIGVHDGAGASRNMFYAINLATPITKNTDENIRITAKAVTLGGLAAFNNLMADLLDGSDVTKYIDGSADGAFINVVLDGAPLAQYNEVSNPAPDFVGSSISKVRFEIQIDTADISGNSLAGEAFSEVDLYQDDPDTTGQKLLDGAVLETTFAANQNVTLQYEVELIR